MANQGLKRFHHSTGDTRIKFLRPLFLVQARLLLRLGRPIDVADRGLRFVRAMEALLEVHQSDGELRPMFKEVSLVSHFKNTVLKP